MRRGIGVMYEWVQQSLKGGCPSSTLQRRIELVVPVTIVTRGAITVGTINAGKVYYAIDMQVGWYPRH
jgi:hypothetical protein